MSTGTPDLQPETAEQLVERAGAGDQAAWDSLVRLYRRKVFNVAYRFVGTHDEAEDLTQDVFLKVFRSLGTFDRRANFQTWLISVSRNLCIDDYRTRRREHETIDRGVDASLLTPGVVRLEPGCGARGAGSRHPAPRRPPGAVADAAVRRAAARPARAVVPGGRRPAGRGAGEPSSPASIEGAPSWPGSCGGSASASRAAARADAKAARSRRSSTRRPTGVSR